MMAMLGKGKGDGKGKGKKGGKPESFQALYKSVLKGGLLGEKGQRPEENQCFVKNLPADTDDLALYKLFSPFGGIPPAGVKAMKNEDGTCKGVGFVDFVESTSAAMATMSLDGHTLIDGSSIS